MVDVVLAKIESVGSETDPRGLHPPFSILYLADSLEKAGYSVALIHEEGTDANVHELADLVANEKPHFVGLSVGTGPSIIPSLEGSKAIREKSEVPIVWGGLQPTLLPQETLKKDYIDVLGFSEGEATVVELANVVSKSGLKASELERVAGIAFRQNGRIVFTEPRPFIKDLDEIGAAWHLLDRERYIRPEIYLASDMGEGSERATAINTSRGCPWRCGFCYNQAVNKRRFRAQSAERVIHDIEELRKRYDISGIRLAEDHFFSNEARAVDIVRNIGLPWSATIRVDDLTRGGDDFARVLAENHCATLRCGVESGAQRVLELIEKDVTVDQVREAVKLCAKYRLRIGFLFMAGFPGETWAEVCQTFDLMDEIEEMSEYALAGLPSIFCPFPGTPLLDRAVELGFESPASLEDWGTTIDKLVRSSGSLPPYVDERVERAIEYLRLARVSKLDNLALALPAKVLQPLARMRWQKRYFSLPVDLACINLGRRLLGAVGLA